MSKASNVKSEPAVALPRLVRQPRHKWFSAPDRRCEDGWYGPHDTIEAAIMECAYNYGTREPIFVTQGYRLTKAEREEYGAEFDWQCDTQNAIEVRLPNDQGQRQPTGDGRKAQNKDSNDQ